VRARDRFGNADRSPATFRFFVDTKKPRVFFTSVDFDRDEAAFSFRSREKRVTYFCRLDDAQWATCKPPVRLADVPEKEHRWQVRARDRAGNVGPPSGREWEVDTRPPNTTITAGPSGRVNSTSATFTFTSSEDGSTFECSRDGFAFAPCTSPVTYDRLSPGRHVFRVRAEDEAGNVDRTRAVRRWSIRDNDPPNTHITSGPRAVTRDATPTFTFTSSEPGSTFECRIDGRAWASCSSPRTYAALSPGPHTFRARATDARGNRDPTPDTWEWVQSG
jgi:hypothetical protein